MAEVPFAFNGVMMPKGKAAGDKPVPCVLFGVVWDPSVSVGGGPIIPPAELPDLPPNEKPPGDLIIWGGPYDPPHPAHPIVIPDPIVPPIDPPTTPTKPHEGWNWSVAKSGWYYIYVPKQGVDPGPKKK